uniref:Endonuclease/exonuclease/phosphatase domain-containing protein n=1 Tax=Lotharella oceanica TaxID=641309 RepID=A0A7S2TSK9_9EUKA
MHHMPMVWGLKALREMREANENSSRKGVSDRDMMATYAFAVMHKFQCARQKILSKVVTDKKCGATHAGTSTDTPMVVVGDWNVMPQNHKVFDLFLGGHNVIADDSLAQNHLIEMLYNPSGRVVSNTAADGGEVVFSSLQSIADLKLASAYFEKFKAHPELTTHTQEFTGALDHMFISENVDVAWMLKMPTAKELNEKKVWTPDLHSEPSDHLLQRAVFQLRVSETATETAPRSRKAHNHNLRSLCSLASTIAAFFVFARIFFESKRAQR